jgi:hypothetical protein
MVFRSDMVFLFYVLEKSVAAPPVEDSIGSSPARRRRRSINGRVSFSPAGHGFGARRVGNRPSGQQGVHPGPGPPAGRGDSGV